MKQTIIALTAYASDDPIGAAQMIYNQQGKIEAQLLALTEEAARAKWLNIRQAMEGVIVYGDDWPPEWIDRYENEIIEVVLAALFDASAN